MLHQRLRVQQLFVLNESKTDPEARLFRRSKAVESRPSYLGHVLTENRNGLVVAACVTQSSSRAEREAALKMLEQISHENRKITLEADTAYQTLPIKRSASWMDCGRAKWCRT